MNDIYVIVGVPASGKSWVADQLKDIFEYVHHDGYIYLKNPAAYLTAVRNASVKATRPLLIECPFSMQILEDLVTFGYDVTPVFIIEKESALRDRYVQRQRHEEHIIKGHLTRQDTFLKRAVERKAFWGNSLSVLAYLKGASEKWKKK
jgi:hypothetical protein